MSLAFRLKSLISVSARCRDKIAFRNRRIPSFWHYWFDQIYVRLLVAIHRKYTRTLHVYIIRISRYFDFLHPPHHPSCRFNPTWRSTTSTHFCVWKKKLWNLNQSYAICLIFTARSIRRMFNTTDCFVYRSPLYFILYITPSISWWFLKFCRTWS